MNDCSNAEIRDQLPDLLHDRLDAKARAEVVAHVDGCVDCRDELELLRSIQRTLMTRTPRVDVAYVVSALPKPRARSVQIQPAHRRWADWRIAAAVTLLVAGGSSVALLNRAPNTGVQQTVVAPLVSRQSPDSNTQLVGAGVNGAATAPSVEATTVASNDDLEAADSGPDGHFAGLSEEQLRQLLTEIDRLQPLPVVDPEPVTIRVDLKPSTPEGA